MRKELTEDTSYNFVVSASDTPEVHPRRLSIVVADLPYRMEIAGDQELRVWRESLGLPDYMTTPLPREFIDLAQAIAPDGGSAGQDVRVDSVRSYLRVAGDIQFHLANMVDGFAFIDIWRAEGVDDLFASSRFEGMLAEVDAALETQSDDVQDTWLRAKGRYRRLAVGVSEHSRAELFSRTRVPEVDEGEMPIEVSIRQSLTQLNRLSES